MESNAGWAGLPRPKRGVARGGLGPAWLSAVAMALSPLDRDQGLSWCHNTQARSGAAPFFFRCCIALVNPDFYQGIELSL
jgi:hypothetical protein